MTAGGTGHAKFARYRAIGEPQLTGGLFQLVGAFGSDGAIARAAVVGLASSEDLARPAGTDASSEKWLDSYRKRSAGLDMWDGGRVPYVIDNTIRKPFKPTRQCKSIVYRCVTIANCC